MPAVSKAQQRLMAMAKFSPEKVSAENQGVLSMPSDTLEDFASTKTTGLPTKVRSPRNSLRTSRGSTLRGLSQMRKKSLGLPKLPSLTGLIKGEKI